VIRSRESVTKDLELGSIEIPVAALKDQIEEDKWYTLRPPADREDAGQIRVKAQWIHSRVKYFESMISKLEEEIADQDQELDNFKRYLARLRKPFGFLEAENWSSKYGAFKKFETETNLKLNQLARDKFKTENLNLYGHTTKAVYIYIILSILVSFYRSDFINLTLSAACWIFVVGKFMHDSPLLLKKLALGVFIAFLVDLVWLTKYFSPWALAEGSNKDGGVENTIKRIVLLFSVMSFLFKLPFSVLLWKDSVDYKTFKDQEEVEVQPKTDLPA